LVLVTTDLLQEGEDLHTFCNEVHHYGIAWMPSSLEQRTGRVDRVNSLTERTLSGPDVVLADDGRPDVRQRLQVLYPFVQDTYVLTRLDEHVRLLHEAFGGQPRGVSRIDVDAEVVDDSPMPSPTENLGEPYPVKPEWLEGTIRRFPVVDGSVAETALAAFAALGDLTEVGDLPIRWVHGSSATHRLAECRIGSRSQPVDLRLTSTYGLPAVRLTSPVRLVAGEVLARLDQLACRQPQLFRIGVKRLGPRERRSFTLTIEDVVLVTDASGLPGLLDAHVPPLVEVADGLEYRLLEVDQPLEVFADDLRTEERRG
jgi:hypothetical protein